MNIALTAIIVTIASIIILVLTEGMKAINARKRVVSQLSAAHLNDLRLYTEETFFRLHEINSRVVVDQKASRLFLPPETNTYQISQQDDIWFNGKGCYFLSSCYFTACLFACIKKIREEIPQRTLRTKNDTAFLSAMFAVSNGFLIDLGIFYATQHSIGNEMYIHDEQRLVTYGEFCQIIQTPHKRIWFDRLISFYLDINQGKRDSNLVATIEGLYGLAQFCDRLDQNNSAIDEQLRTDNNPPFMPHR